MHKKTEVELSDLQGLLRFGYGPLTETCFLLLDIVDAAAAKQWLATAPVTSGITLDEPPPTALQVAFSARGLRKLGLREELLAGFADEFTSGMAGDESRSRRLGDIDANAPTNWLWGGDPEHIPDLLLLLYAREGAIESWRSTLEGNRFHQAFQLQYQLPTLFQGAIEPFGFADGVSQPIIDWHGQQSTDSHERDRYSNKLAVGEVVLGYTNEYGLYTTRPLIDPAEDPCARELPDAEDIPALKDLGRNGSYLVLRQLAQDVPAFWRFLDREAQSDPQVREQLAAQMVGRHRDGTPLIPPAQEPLPGIALQERNNDFTYDQDPLGHRCPLGAHIRRANPRSGDFPFTVTGLLSRLVHILGFGQKRPEEDLVASSRFHRILRRGRTYGPALAPERAVSPDAPDEERGLQFIALVGNISRQFEFVQNAWIMNSKFAGVQQERDPLLGIRRPLAGGEPTGIFVSPDPSGPARKTCHLPQFITVKGGGYFFLPGLRALRYLTTLPATSEEQP